MWPKLPTYFDDVTTIKNNRQVGVNIDATLVAIFRIPNKVYMVRVSKNSTRKPAFLLCFHREPSRLHSSICITVIFGYIQEEHISANNEIAKLTKIPGHE